MYIIAGLGNPGSTYEHTRHNIGFLTLDALSEKIGCRFSSSKWNSDTAKTLYCGEQVVLVKPTTFMNLSGQCLAAVAKYYKVPMDHIVIVHDDLDLELGRIKICQNRGHGGHNGLKSIISHLGGKDFIRVKMGIGRNPHKIPVEKYVLSKFSKSDLDIVENQVKLAVESVELILENGVADAMQTIHSRPF